MNQANPKKRGPAAWLLSATKDQARDTGMAMVLICLLFAYWGQRPWCVPLAIILLLVTMAVPQVFRPLAVFWFGLSHILGNVVSRVVLSVIFFVLVTPIGLLRRWAGKDAMQVRKWKQGRDSVFVSRQGAILPEDLNNPY